MKCLMLQVHEDFWGVKQSTGVVRYGPKKNSGVRVGAVLQIMKYGWASVKLPSFTVFPVGQLLIDEQGLGFRT